MLQLGILLTKYHRLLSAAAMIDVFESANRFLEQRGEEPFFSISLLHPSGSKPPVYAELPVYSLAAAPDLDMILIPSFMPTDLAQAINVNQECIGWLQQQRIRGAEIASFCTGAFLLAATGLLDQKPATTHIQAAQAFARSFPNVQV